MPRLRDRPQGIDVAGGQINSDTRNVAHRGPRITIAENMRSRLAGDKHGKPRHNDPPYSTVTDFAKFRGWSTSVPFSTATW